MPIFGDRTRKDLQEIDAPIPLVSLDQHKLLLQRRKQIAKGLVEKVRDDKVGNPWPRTWGGNALRDCLGCSKTANMFGFANEAFRTRCALWTQVSALADKTKQANDKLTRARMNVRAEEENTKTLTQKLKTAQRNLETYKKDENNAKKNYDKASAKIKKMLRVFKKPDGTDCYSEYQKIYEPEQLVKQRAELYLAQVHPQRKDQR